MNPLITSFRVRDILLANRIVMAPMTRGQSPDGIPGPEVAAYYRRRAEQGVGLIITEGTGIDHPAALGMPNVPFFHGVEALEGCAGCGVSDGGVEPIPLLGIPWAGSSDR